MKCIVIMGRFLFFSFSFLIIHALILEDNDDTPLDQSFAEEPKEGT